MMRVIIKPHVGIQIDNLVINFGDNISNIKLNATSYDKKDYYILDGNIRFEVDNNVIVAIECCMEQNDDFVVEYGGKCLSNMFICNVIDIVSITLNENVMIEEENFFLWKESDLSFWQSITEKEALNSIDEAKKEGEYEKMKEELENDLKRSKYFTTVCLGIKGYYKSRNDNV